MSGVVEGGAQTETANPAEVRKTDVVEMEMGAAGRCA
jgi:hypothetical protein